MSSGSSWAPPSRPISSSACSSDKGAPRLLVGHRVEGVRNREDARGERDVAAVLAPRIPPAVPTLVVRPDHLPTKPVQPRHVRHDPLAEPRMLANLVELSGRQRCALQHHSVGHREHPDVVQPATVFETSVLKQLGCDPRSEGHRKRCHSLGVLARLRKLATTIVPELERAHQSIHNGNGDHRLGDDRVGNVADTSDSRARRHDCLFRLG